MSGPLIIIVGLIYAYVAGEQYWQGNYAMSLVWGGYAFANLGLYAAMK